MPKILFRNTFRIILGMFFLANIFVGCATMKKGEEGIPILDRKVEELEVSPDFEKNAPLKVAILPFENLTNRSEAFEIVRRSFYNHFASKRYQDVELYKVDTVLRQKGLFEDQRFLMMPPGKLGELLDADGLIYGKISGFDRIFLGAYSQVSVELEVKLVKASTGEPLWKAKHRATHREGDIPLSLMSIIPAMIRTALNVRDIELLRTANDLSRVILATLPEPTIGKVLKAPKITFLAHDSMGKWKKAGDTIHVGMVGEPKMVATFDLADIKKGIPMTEEKKGVYSGYYKVMSGDKVSGGLVIGHLMDERGNRSDWVDPLNVINIDTFPPERPSKPSVFGRDQSVFLKWADSGDEDLLQYKVYRSEAPRDGYVEVTRTQLNKFHDKGLNNGIAYYYRISAIDRAGNESDLTDLVRCIPLKPGPTFVSDDVVVDTVWFAGSSPYIIKETIEVMNGTTLTIEPGCVVKSEESAIVIRGKLLAQGKEDNFIQLIGAGKEREGFSWEGIIFDNTHDAESRVEYCKIKQARISISMISSSPSISRNIITQNGTGIVIREFSKPIILGNTIVDNRQAGILCERSDPEISENIISENGGGGIICRNALPIIKNNNLVSNGKCDLFSENESSMILTAMDNWWGSTDLAKVSLRIKGTVNYARILDDPYPEGKPIDLVKERAKASHVETAGRIHEAEQQITPTEISGLMDQAIDHMNQGANSEAKEALLKIVASQPDNHKAYFLLGMIHYQAANIKEALKNMEKAVKLDPKNPGYRYNLGLAFNETGDTSRALEEWRKVIELDPQNQNARMLLEMYDRNTD